MKAKLCIEHAYIALGNLEEGVNSRQCAERGVKMLEVSIAKMGWVDTGDIIVTVHPDCEAEFKDYTTT
jgi:hypothetical protein